MTPHCLPWTRSGAGAGWRHPEIETFIIAVREHAAGSFDLTMLEEAFDFPPEAYLDEMVELHKVASALIIMEDRRYIPESRRSLLCGYVECGMLNLKQVFVLYATATV